MVIVADLRAMADWLPVEAQRISGMICVGRALDGTSYLIRHSFQQIGERQPTVEDLSHPAWQWVEQAVQSRADSKSHHGFGDGWRVAIASNAVMSCITACIPARIDRNPASLSRFIAAVRSVAIAPAPLPR